jgi:hypothetical protein
MGNNQQARIIKPLEKFDVELVCDKIYHHLNLQRNRKINELATKERELADKLRSKRRTYNDTVIDIGVLVNLLKYITAAKIVSRYSQLIKNHSMVIADCCRTNNYTPIRELSQYFEGIVWSTDKLNLSYISEFNMLIQRHFRTADVQEIMKFNKVDKELLNCFSSIEPSPVEVQEYLVQFLARHQIQNFQWPGGMAPQAPGQGYQQGGAYLPPAPGGFGYQGQPQGGPFPGPGGFQAPGFPGQGGPGGQGMPQFPPGHNQFPPQGPNTGGQFAPGQPSPYDDAAIDDLIKNLNLGVPGGNDLTPLPGAPSPIDNNVGLGLPPTGGLGVPPQPNNNLISQKPGDFDPNNFGGLPPAKPQNFQAQPANNGLTPPPFDVTPVIVPITSPAPTPAQQAAPVPPPPQGNHGGYPQQTTQGGPGGAFPTAQQLRGPPVKVRQYATGPEAYTDDNDDNCEFAQFEPLTLAQRIEEMRKNKV